jgi:signal transduction histidine kinase
MKWFAVIKKNFIPILISVGIIAALVCGFLLFFLIKNAERGVAKESVFAINIQQAVLATGFVFLLAAALVILPLRFKNYAAKKKAEKEKITLTAFLARMSHEIKTPLNSITGMARLALRENLPAKTRDYLLTINKSGEDLLATVNDMLDIAYIESGKLKIAEEEYLFADLITDILAIIRTRLGEKPFRPITKIDGTLPRILCGDKERICQALLNLLLSAVQHTDEGGITLTIHGEKTARQSKEIILLAFIIQDTGSGIEDGHLRALLNNAADFGQETEKDFGIAVSGNLCRLMGGSLTAKSVRGQGSAFTVAIPQKIIDNAPFAFVKESAKKRVIVYEARRHYVESLVYTLNNLGVMCSAAHSPNELIAQLSESTDFVFVSLAFVGEVSAILAQENTRARLVGLSYPGEKHFDGAQMLYLPLHPLDAADILNGKNPQNRGIAKRDPLCVKGGCEDAEK